MGKSWNIRYEHLIMWVHNVICHPCGSGKHSAYKHGDDRGMVYGMVLPTFYPLSAKKKLTQYLDLLSTRLFLNKFG